MEALAESIANPEKRFSSIHVAGTNGKGSVCAMLESIYRSNGYKTGLFTSPHLIRLNERIQINRIPISDLDLATYVNELRSQCDEQFSSATTHPSLNSCPPLLFNILRRKLWILLSLKQV